MWFKVYWTYKNEVRDRHGGTQKNNNNKRKKTSRCINWACGHCCRLLVWFVHVCNTTIVFDYKDKMCNIIKRVWVQSSHVQTHTPKKRSTMAYGDVVVGGSGDGGWGRWSQKKCWDGLFGWAGYCSCVVVWVWCWLLMLIWLLWFFFFWLGDCDVGENDTHLGKDRSWGCLVLKMWPHW